jgi:anthranilate synthase component 2
MLLMIDNYDSFTYNLVQYFCELDQEVQVRRNDEITLDGIENLKPKYLVISPGPCTPKESGISVEVIKQFKEEIPILGVCLGHQCIAHAFGSEIVRAKELMHGKLSPIIHDNSGVFQGMKNSFVAARYHSLVIEPETLPVEFNVNASTEDGTIMGISHQSLPLVGLQFHPESIATEQGINLLSNFLEIYKQ